MEMLSLSNVCNTEAKWKFHIEWNNALTFADIDRGRERIQIKIFSSSTFMLTRARPHSTCLHTIQMQRTLAKWMLMHPFVQVSTLDSVIFHGHTQGNRMPLKTVNRYSIKLRWCHSTFFFTRCVHCYWSVHNHFAARLSENRLNWMTLIGWLCF